MPPHSERTLGRRLGQIALALLNATLLLALALTIAGLVLVARVQSFAADTAAAAAAAIGPDIRGRVAQDLDVLRTALDRLGAVEARLSAGADRADRATAAELAALRAELAQLRAEVAALTEGVADLRATAEAGLRAALHRLAAEAERRLAAAPIQPAE